MFRITFALEERHGILILFLVSVLRFKLNPAPTPPFLSGVDVCVIFTRLVISVRRRRVVSEDLVHGNIHMGAANF